MPIDVESYIRQQADEQGIPAALALGVAEQESGFNPTKINPQAVNGEHATGTFQLLPSTAKTLGVDYTDPKQNIQGGVKYLRQLMDRHNGDLNAVLGEYGGVKTDQTYVPSVLARVKRFQQQPAPAQTQTQAPATTTPPPAPRTWGQTAMDVGQSILQGLDPRTSVGQRNLAGAVGATAASILAPEVELPILGVRAVQFGAPLVGAYLGGAGAQTAQDVAAGKTPTAESAMGAGREQMGQQATGELAAWPIKAFWRGMTAAGTAKKISATLSDAIDAAESRITGTKPSVTPSQAGKMVEGVTQGPAKDVLDQLGQDVTAAAKTGPPIPTQPIKDRIADLKAQMTPSFMASHEAVPATLSARSGRGVSYLKGDQLTKMAAEHPELGLSTIPADHPLPAVLGKIEQGLTDQDHISFEDAQKVKRALDETVNWDSPAKKQVQQASKGLRITLRDLMASHEPYNQATERYGQVARLYTRPVQTLHKEILNNPEGIVQRMNWTNPSSAAMLKQLTVDTASQAGPEGAQQGTAAWNALRAAWTHDKLVAKGPAGMMSEIGKMEASGSGQEFLKTMYGDQQGQAVLQNLKQIGSAWQEATDRAATFKTTEMAGARSPVQAAGDIASLALHAHPIYAARSGARLLAGPRVKDLIQWAAYSPDRTRFVVNHLKTGPNMGQAVADLLRWKEMGEDTEPSGPPPETTPPPMPSHVTTPPPALTSQR